MSDSSAEKCPLYLVRDPDVDTKFLCELPYGSRVLQEMPPNKNDICLLVIENSLSDLAAVDPTYGGDDKFIAHCSLDRAREVGVECFRPSWRKVLLGVVTS